MCRQHEYYHKSKGRAYRLTIGGGGLYVGLDEWCTYKETGREKGQWGKVFFSQGDESPDIADKYDELGWRGFIKWLVAEGYL